MAGPTHPRVGRLTLVHLLTGRGDFPNVTLHPSPGLCWVWA